MAYTRLQVRDLIKQRCNLEDTTAQTNTEINNHINDAVAYTHDFLIATWGERYARANTSFNTVAGTSEYTIAANDYYRPIAVRVRFDDLDYPIKPFSWKDSVTSTTRASWDPRFLPRYSFNFEFTDTIKLEFSPIPDAANTVTLKYHTRPTTFSADGDLVRIPAVDLVIIEACIRVKDKDEREASRFMQERALIQKRIEDWDSQLDKGNANETLRTGRFGGRSRGLPDGRLF